MKKTLLILSLFYTTLYGDTLTNNPPLITKYIVGKPAPYVFEAKERVAKRWGIRMKHIFAGCKVGNDTWEKKKIIEQDNKKAYIYYSKKFGKDWQIKFENDVEKEKNQLKNP